MADEKSLGINVSADVSDAESKLNDLIDTINGMVDRSINISIETDASQLDGVENDLNQIDGQILNETVQVDEQGVQETKIHLEEMGTAGDTASNQIQAAMPGAVKSIEEVGEKSKEASNQTEIIGTKAAESGDKAEIGMATAALAVLGLVTALDMAAKSVQDLNIYFDKVASTTIPEEEWRKLFAEMSNAKFPVEEVRTYVTLLKQMGLTTEDSLRRGAEAFNDIRIATGSSEDAVKRFASSVVVMGVDLNNLPSTFNAVAYAQSNVIGGFETYVQWMQKYDATFKEMGLSIDQTAVIIAAATKKWGGGRAAYQGLNQALQESGGNLDVLEEKLGLHNNELDNATQLTAQYSGKIEKNSDIVRDNTTSSEKAKDTWSDINVIFGDLIQTVADYGWQILQLGAIVGLVIPGILKWFDQLWSTNWATKYTDILGKAGTKIKDFGVNIGKTVKGWMGWGDDAGRAAYNIGTQIDGKIEKPTIWTKLKDFGSRVRGVITRDWAFWADDAGRVTANMVKGIDDTYTVKSPGILEKIANFGRRLPTVLSDAVGSVGLKLPSFEGVGASIPESFSKGFLRSLPRVVGDLAFFGVTIIDALMHPREFFDDPFGFIMGGLSPSQAPMLPGFLKDLFSVDWWLRLLMGDAETESFYTTFETLISKPLTDAILALPGQIWGALTGIGKIDIFGSIFGTGGTAGTGVDPFAGIKESFNGFMAWLTTIPSQIASTFTMSGLTSVIDTVLFDIGRIARFFYELPGQIWDYLSTLPGVISTAFNNVLVYISTLPEQFVGWGQGIWTAFTNGLNSGLDGIKSAISQPNRLLDDLLVYLQSLPEQLTKLASSAWQGLIDGFNSLKSKIKQTVDDAMKKIDDGIQYIRDLPGKMWEWGWNTIKSWADGLKQWAQDNWDGLKGWLNDRLKYLWDGWETHSPPKALPNIDKWGEGLAETYLKSISHGIDKNKGFVIDGLADIGANFNLNNVSLPTPNPTNIVNSNRVGGAVFNINVPMQGAGKDDKTALETGKQVGKGIVSELEGWALDGGLSTINAMRSV